MTDVSISLVVVNREPFSAPQNSLTSTFLKVVMEDIFCVKCSHALKFSPETAHFKVTYLIKITKNNFLFLGPLDMRPSLYLQNIFKAASRKLFDLMTDGSCSD